MEAEVYLVILIRVLWVILSSLLLVKITRSRWSLRSLWNIGFWFKSLMGFFFLCNREIYSFNKTFFLSGCEGVPATKGCTAGHLRTTVKSNAALLIIQLIITALTRVKNEYICSYLSFNCFKHYTLSRYTKVSDHVQIHFRMLFVFVSADLKFE